MYKEEEEHIKVEEKYIIIIKDDAFIIKDTKDKNIEEHLARRKGNYEIAFYLMAMVRKVFFENDK